MGVPGGHPVQGRWNRERPHFFGQPKICPSLHLTHYIMFAEKVPPVFEIAPLVLRPPPPPTEEYPHDRN